MNLFRDLVAHYRKIELHEEDRKQLGDNDKSFSTKYGYTSLLDSHILPQWGDWDLGEIDRVAFAVEVEGWLKTLRKLNKKPMSKGSKAKIRNVMSAVFTHAIRYRFADRNPIEGVRQSAKRERVPSRLTEAELYALMHELELMYRVLLLLLVPTGMRRGEILALQWKDVNWIEKTLSIHKAIWHQHLGPVKTEESEKVMPLDNAMPADLST